MKKAIEILTELRDENKCRIDYDENLGLKLEDVINRFEKHIDTLRMLRGALGSPYGINAEDYRTCWSEHMNKMLN